MKWIIPRKYSLLDSKASIWKNCVCISRQDCRLWKLQEKAKKVWWSQFFSLCNNDSWHWGQELSRDEPVQPGQALETLHQPVWLLWHPLQHHCQGRDHSGGPEVPWPPGKCDIREYWFVNVFNLSPNIIHDFSESHVSSGGSTEDLAKKYFSELDITMVKKLYDLYKVDFEMFDYSPDEYFKVAKNPS